MLVARAYSLEQQNAWRAQAELCHASSFLCSVLFFSRPRSEGWPHHGRTFCIYLCPLPFWLTLPWGVLSTYWCCPSRPCVVFLACVHLALFLALSLSGQLPCFLMVWPYYASFLALTVSSSFVFTPAFLRTHSITCFFAVHETPRIFLSPFISKASRRVSSFFLSVHLSLSYVATILLTLYRFWWNSNGVTQQRNQIYNCWGKICWFSKIVYIQWITCIIHVIHRLHRTTGDIAD